MPDETLHVEARLISDRLKRLCAEMGKQTDILNDIRALLRLMHYGPSNTLAQEVEQP